MFEYFAELGGLGYVVSTVFTGLAIVFTALILLIAFVSILGMAFKGKKQTNSSSSSGNGSKAVGGAPAVENGISDEVVAAIAAAVAAMSSDGKSYTVRSIKIKKLQTRMGGGWNL